jgi:hypothetical protein
MDDVRYAKIDSGSGRIVAIQTNTLLAPDEEGAFLFVDMVDLVDAGESLDDYYYDGAGIMPRPDKPVIPADGIAPLVIDLSFNDSAALIEVTNQDGDTLTVDDTSLTLTTAGIYWLRITQPFPHHTLLAKVRVNG